MYAHIHTCIICEEHMYIYIQISAKYLICMFHEAYYNLIYFRIQQINNTLYYNLYHLLHDKLKQSHNDLCYMDNSRPKLLDKVDHVRPVIRIPFCTPHSPVSEQLFVVITAGPPLYS